MRVLQILQQVLVGMLVALIAAPPALAGVVLDEVVEGDVTRTTPSAGYTLIEATNGSIGNYSDANTVRGETLDVQIIDGDGGSHVMRIISLAPTQFDGELLSNGHVYMVNPAGVYFGENAQVVDVVGLHAAAGQIDLTTSAFADTDGTESVRYTGLTGTVSNLGTISAEVVDLIGRQVVNGGSITSSDSGFFALVVGNDVTIVRGEDDTGAFGQTVTIEGLAQTLLAELESPLEQTEAGSIDAGPDGEAVLALGAGDLLGASMRFAGTLRAKHVTLASRGGDLQVDGEITAEITAENSELCAGTACVVLGQELALDGDRVTHAREFGDEPREKVVIGPGATFSGGSLRVQSEGELRVDHELAIDETLELLGADELFVTAEVRAAKLALEAGLDGTGELTVGDVALRADDLALRSATAIGLDPAARLTNTAGVAAPGRLSLTQAQGIDGQILSQEPIQALDVAGDFELTLAAETGVVALDLEAPADGVNDLLELTDLRLESGVFGIDVNGDLQSGSLVLRTPGLARVSGDLTATDGDVTLEGSVLLDGSANDQVIQAQEGRILQPGFDGDLGIGLIKDTRNLLLDAGPSAGASPIDLDGDLRVLGGNLEIAQDFSVGGDIEVVARPSDADPDVLEPDSGEFLLKTAAQLDGDSGQTIRAERLGIAGSVTKTAAEADAATLLLEAVDTLTVEDRVAITAQTLTLAARDVELAPAPVSALFLASTFALRQTEALGGGDVANAVVRAAGADAISVESTGAQLDVDADLATTAAELTLRAREGLQVTSTIEANALVLHAGAGASTSHDLVLGSDAAAATLRATAIELRAGNDGLSVADGGGSAVDLVDASVTGRDGAPAPETITVRQDAALDADAFAAQLEAETLVETLVLRSDGGDVVLDEETKAQRLELISNDDVSVLADVTVAGLDAEFVARAGADGTGDVLVGMTRTPGADATEPDVYADAATQPELTGPDVELVAGDGRSGLAQVRIGSGVAFDGTVDFKLEQDASIVDGSRIPDLGPGFAGALSLLSQGGSVDVVSADKIEGTDLTLGGATGVHVGLGDGVDLLDVKSLRVAALDAFGVAEFEQGVRASSGDIEFETALVLRGAREEQPLADRLLEASAGDLIALRGISLGEADGFQSAQNLTLSAANQVRLEGDLSFQSSPTALIDGVEVALDSKLTLEADSLELSGITTAAVPAEDPDMTVAAPGIDLRARLDSVRLSDSIAAGTEGDLRGDLDIEAPGGIELGRADAADGNTFVELGGADVTLAGSVRRTVVNFEEEDGSFTDITDQFSRTLVVGASGDAVLGDAELGSTVDVTHLEVVAGDQASVLGDVTTHPVEALSDPSTSVSLASGADGSGNLVIGASRITASRISLTAGAIDADPDAEPDGESADFDLADGTRLVGLDGDAPSAASFTRDPGFEAGDVADLLGRLGETQTTPEGVELGFVSLEGTVSLDAAQVNGNALTLGGTEIEGGAAPIVVQVADGESLDLLSLELQDRAEIGSAEIGGNLVLSEGQLVAGGDKVTVDGNAELLAGGASFTSAQPQTFKVKGRLQSLFVASGDGHLTIDADDDLELAVDVEPTSGDITSASANGELTLKSGGSVRLGGDIIARRDVDLSSGSVELVGTTGQQILSAQEKVVVAGPVSKMTAAETDDRDLVIGGEEGFDLSGSIVAGQDLVLVGPGVLRDDAGSVRAENGNLVLATNALSRAALPRSDEPDLEPDPASGGIDARGVAQLTLAAGGEIIIDGTGAVENEIVVEGQSIAVDAAVVGDGSLTVDVRDAGEAGRIRIAEDVTLGTRSTLELASQAVGGIEIAGEQDGVREVSAGTLLFNPGDREDTSEATLFSDGDLRLRALDGNVEMGVGEVVTVSGELDIEATGTASLGELNALSISVSAAEIRPNASEVDWNANSVEAFGEVASGLVVGTPTGVETNDALAVDGVRHQALRPDLSPLVAADLVEGAAFVDLSPSGPVAFDSARELPAQEGADATSMQQPTQSVASAFPLAAGEMIALLDGSTLADRARMQRDPAMRGLIQGYGGLTRAESRRDPLTGLPLVSSSPEPRSALAEAVALYLASGGTPTRAGFTLHLEMLPEGGEAVSALADLRRVVELAEKAGLDPDDADRFRELLVAKFVPAGTSRKLLIDTLR